MSRHDRAGSKPGAGGVASREAMEISRKQRLRDLAMETTDLSKDPYLMRNHLGSLECKLCGTIHNNEGNYLAHTQGKRHKSNLARRAAHEAERAKRERSGGIAAQQAAARQAAAEAAARAAIQKIGRPGFRVERAHDPATGQRVLRFEVDYPRIMEGCQPRHRIMSSYEQKVEPTDDRYQYLLIAGLPYQTIGFKIPNDRIDRQPGKFSTSWNREDKVFQVSLTYMDAPDEDDKAGRLEAGGVPPVRRPIEVLGGGGA